MNKLILVISIPVSGVAVCDYCGFDFNEASKIYALKASDESLLNVSFVNNPKPQKFTKPLENAQLVKRYAAERDAAVKAKEREQEARVQKLKADRAKLDNEIKQIEKPKYK